MSVPDPTKEETDTEVTYTVYSPGDANPGQIIIHKTIPVSYTIKPSSLQIEGKTWEDVANETEVALGLVTEGVAP